VEEIVIRGGVRERVEEIAGERKRAVAWAAAVAVLLLLALALTRRPPTSAIAPPATSTAATDDVMPSPAVVVHVAGAVENPGLYEFSEGMRIADAIEAAGGPLRKADLDAINLAELLSDRLKIEVPVRGRAVDVTAPSASASPGPVNLNTADQAALETIPGIGPVTATAILQHRAELGSYESVEQLLDVTGIGPATLESLRPYVSV